MSHAQQIESTTRRYAQLLADRGVLLAPADIAALPDAPLILSTFTDDAGRRVVAAVNRQDREPLQTAVPLKSARRVSRPDLDTGEEILLGEALDTLPVDLPAGGLALYILE